MDNTASYYAIGGSRLELDALSKEEHRLIEALRAHLGWGEATVVLKAGVPVMLKGLREDVKLTDTD
jgi:hypothetical protein